MRTVYEAYDGTRFTSTDDCFDYEWREHFPDLRIYNSAGVAVATVSDLYDGENIFMINSAEERKFVRDYLTTFYGDVGFSEMYATEYSGDDGYIIETEAEISYVSRVAARDYYKDDLPSDSDLMIDLGEEA